MTIPFRKLAQFFSPKATDQSVCESCGNEFSCGASLRGCWCSEIKLSDERRAETRSRYRSCLCRGCLEQLSEREFATCAVDNDR